MLLSCYGLKVKLLWIESFQIICCLDLNLVDFSIGCYVVFLYFLVEFD